MTDVDENLAPISKVGGGIKRVPGLYLIWSNYHGAWHRRGASGSAQGYTTALEAAGLFDWDVAKHYNEGKRGRDRLITPNELRNHVRRRRAELQATLDNLANIESRLKGGPRQTAFAP
ncbi:MAG: hypothetical protein SWI22_02360 [Pseudomonadota bacterium]|nr:hypothetical protein [Pseudomonadota bacterium]